MDPQIVIRALAVAALTAALAGCSLFGMGTYAGSLCPVGPFIGDPGASQRLTRAEKEYVVTLNQAGEAVCGWRAPKKADR